MSNFTIDFFELLFLAEACIPPQPIARACFFENMSDVHYHQMSIDERFRMFEMIKPKLNLENEDCRYFFARYNPKNQYLVSCFHNGKADEIHCFRFNELYHTSKNRSVNPQYIKSAILINK